MPDQVKNPEKYEIKPKDKEILTRMLTALYPGVKIYLFGSYARGEARVSSDIDLALDYGDKQLTRHNIAMAKNVDVVDLNKAPNYLREIILEEGIEWTKKLG